MKMKKVLTLLAALALGAGSVFATEGQPASAYTPEITAVKVVPRTPWENKVDIYVTYKGLVSGRIEYNYGNGIKYNSYRLGVEITDSNGQTLNDIEDKVTFAYSGCTIASQKLWFNAHSVKEIFVNGDEGSYNANTTYEEFYGTDTPRTEHFVWDTENMSDLTKSPLNLRIFIIHEFYNNPNDPMMAQWPTD